MAHSLPAFGALHVVPFPDTPQRAAPEFDISAGACAVSGRPSIFAVVRSMLGSPLVGRQRPRMQGPERHAALRSLRLRYHPELAASGTG